MKFIVAATALCVATVAITSVDAAKTDRKGKQKAATSRILRKKLPTKGEAAAAAMNKAEDKVLAEDEGYWERFLQNEVPSITDPPTPGPTPGPTPPPTPGPTPPPTPGPTPPPTPGPTPPPTPGPTPPPTPGPTPPPTPAPTPSPTGTCDTEVSTTNFVFN